ncbi:nephrin-like [Penaeus japonicus]|uniref:nephrin-like n=1 Tax=Penaeus japonicus TaxID=27405 RepID=UPI001C70EAB7|nr:nephrin-like [Penaeus japonicus]
MYLTRGILVITLILLGVASRQNTAAGAHKGVWRRVEAVSGREAVLPCEVGAVENSDMLYVVLWYRNGEKEPIYSYDNRPGRLQVSEDRHLIKSELLEGRVTFRTGLVPALHIKPVMRRDEANYTCRIDFRIASSRRTHLSLHVVELPGQPVLRVGGQRATDGVLGPLQEGTALAITCSVSGGVPAPKVVWKRQEKILDPTVESRSPTLTVNQLNIARLTRVFHNVRLTCVASNNNVTAPVEASITVTMNLRPLVTRLEAPPKGLRVGREYEISCISAGSRPHPNITWTLGNVASLTPITANTEHGVNMSTSRVRVTASRRHHGQRLTCTSLNPLFPAYPLSDSILLNVTYPPVATIELGRGVSSVVKEGEDIYFNCNVDSNPPTYKISWYHRGRPLLHAPDRGLLLSGNSLALRSVTRHQAGPYMCAASNVEGDAQSRPLNLSVNYSPVCADDSDPSKVYATGLGQYINVTCTVKASPNVAKYLWVFNNSVTSERIPGDQVFKTPDGGSVVRFIARAHQDYGTLQCWAQNSVGRMTQPCLFHVVPAGRPDQPVGCSVVNKTYDSLAVGCMPGFDGGLEQTFLAKVFEAVTGRSQVNVSSRWPNFTLEGLTPGLDYIIQVMARNALGNSDPVRLEAFTYKMAENRMRDEQVEEEPGEEGPAAGVLLGSLVVVVVLVLVLALLVRCLWARRGQEGHRGRGKSRGYAPPEKPGGGLSGECYAGLGEAGPQGLEEEWAICLSTVLIYRNTKVFLSVDTQSQEVVTTIVTEDGKHFM